MQTFLPYPSFQWSLESLDPKRLGKVRADAWTILRALHKGPVTVRIIVGAPHRTYVHSVPTAWWNDRCLQMWIGRHLLLRQYLTMACDLWTSLGYKDTIRDRIGELEFCEMEALPITSDGLVRLTGEDEFHNSHKSNLLRKDPVFYGRRNWQVEPNMRYRWNPTPWMEDMQRGIIMRRPATIRRLTEAITSRLMEVPRNFSARALVPNVSEILIEGDDYKIIPAPGVSETSHLLDEARDILHSWKTGNPQLPESRAPDFNPDVAPTAAQITEQVRQDVSRSVGVAAESLAGEMEQTRQFFAPLFMRAILPPPGSHPPADPIARSLRGITPEILSSGLVDMLIDEPPRPADPITEQMAAPPPPAAPPAQRSIELPRTVVWNGRVTREGVTQDQPRDPENDDFEGNVTIDPRNPLGDTVMVFQGGAWREAVGIPLTMRQIETLAHDVLEDVPGVNRPIAVRGVGNTSISVGGELVIIPMETEMEMLGSTPIPLTLSQLSRATDGYPRGSIRGRSFIHHQTGEVTHFTLVPNEGEEVMVVDGSAALHIVTFQGGRWTGESRSEHVVRHMNDLAGISSGPLPFRAPVDDLFGTREEDQAFIDLVDRIVSADPSSSVQFPGPSDPPSPLGHDGSVSME